MEPAPASDRVDADVQGIAVAYWNPTRADRDGISRPVNNFGDLIGPRIVAELIKQHGFDGRATDPRRLFSVGSILHFANAGDVVWGTGINGKAQRASTGFPRMDVRAVRGPATRRRLRAQGIDVPAVFGDPALLLPRVMPDLLEIARAEPTRDVTIVPNLNDFDPGDPDPRIIDPRAPLDHVLATIASSRLVVGSSLHAIIVAESLGRPARAVRSRHEHFLKYFDYYAGTGRMGVHVAGGVDEAVALGGVAPGMDRTAELESAFPVDLWTGAKVDATPRSFTGESPAEWLVEAGERWAAADFGTPRPDEAWRFDRDVLVGFLAAAHCLADTDLAEAMPIVAGAAVGVVAGELSHRNREVLRYASAGDVASVRALSRISTRARSAVVDEVQWNVDTLTLIGRVILNELDEPELHLTISSGESDTVSVVALDDVSNLREGEWRWVQHVPIAALLARKRVFGMSWSWGLSESERAKIRYAPGARVTGEPVEPLSLSRPDGRFVFTTLANAR